MNIQNLISPPGGPVDSLRARDGRRSIPTQGICLHRPTGGRSASATVLDIFVNWQRTEPPAALQIRVVTPDSYKCRFIGHCARVVLV